jgi:hypothetical protein
MQAALQQWILACCRRQEQELDLVCGQWVLHVMRTLEVIRGRNTHRCKSFDLGDLRWLEMLVSGILSRKCNYVAVGAGKILGWGIRRWDGWELVIVFLVIALVGVGTRRVFPLTNERCGRISSMAAASFALCWVISYGVGPLLPGRNSLWNTQMPGLQ